MTIFQINSSEARKVFSKLEDDQLTEVSIRVALDAQDFVSPYPPVRRLPQPFVSERQRRWFFYALRAGLIEVPYRRGVSPGSQDMINKWNILPQRSGLALLRNRSTYASWVIGAKIGQQARYHAGNWKSTDEMAEMIVASDIIPRVIDKYVSEIDPR